VDVSTATSLQDVVDLINAAPGNVVASLAPNGNGIQLADPSAAVPGGSLTVDAPPGNQAAHYLGLVPAGETEQNSTLTNTDGDYVLAGKNVLGNDLVIRASDGTEFWLDLAGVTTVQDVLDRINGHPENASVVARLARTGNGIELVDSSGGAGTLSVSSVEGSQAAEFLGFVASGATASNSGDVQVIGTDQVLKSADKHTIETESVFNTLIRLREALEGGDVGQIAEGLDRLTADLDRLNFSRAEIGTRLQDLDVIGYRLEDEDVQLRTALSNDVDIDMVEAISNLTARQFAYQASLQTAGSMLQLSLLDFI